MPLTSYCSPEYTVYDPLLGYAVPVNSTSIPGYDIWPEQASPREAKIRIMALGGSTSWWPRCCWSKFLTDLCISSGKSAMVFNGGLGGYASSQELLKLLRDVEAINPTIILNLSGVNDYYWFHLCPDNPLVHKYQMSIGEYLVENSSAFKSYQNGIHSNITPHQNWLRNIRLMKAICDELNYKIYTFLQPTLGYGDYNPTPEEQGYFDQFAHRILQSGKTYFEEMTYFNDQVRKEISNKSEQYPHVRDLTMIFSGMSGLYRDYRHQNNAGDRIIANEMLKILQTENAI
jgi:hypothetical protein